MAAMTTAERILGLLADITEVEEVLTDPDLPLYDLHILDSLGTVELIVAVSDAFGVDISPAELDREQWATPRRLVADLRRRMGE